MQNDRGQALQSEASSYTLGSPVCPTAPGHLPGSSNSVITNTSSVAVPASTFSCSNRKPHL